MKPVRIYSNHIELLNAAHAIAIKLGYKLADNTPSRYPQAGLATILDITDKEISNIPTVRSATRLINLDTDWSKFMATMSGAYAEYKIKGYAVTLRLDGAVQFGCTLVRPTTLNAVIKALNSKTTASDARVEAIEIASDDSYLLDAVMEMIRDEFDVTGNPPTDDEILYFYKDTKTGEFAFTNKNLDFKFEKGAKLQLPKDWNKVYTLIDDFIVDHGEDTVSGDDEPEGTSINAGNYHLIINSKGVYVVDDNWWIERTELEPLLADVTALQRELAADKPKAVAVKKETKTTTPRRSSTPRSIWD